MKKITAFAPSGVPLIKKGSDLALLVSKLVELKDKDIVVFSSTIVSKSEGRTLPIKNIVPSERAKRIAKKNKEDPRFVEAVLRESEDVLVEHPFMLVQTRSGHICPNAGIDRSNIEDGFLLLHPKNADESARGIGERIRKLSGKKVSVIISDTCGRAFRIGQVGTAIGCCNILPTSDWRGARDLYGNVLKVKNEGIIDELSAIANILMGESSEGTPIVAIRGLNLYSSARCGAKNVFRPAREDIIRGALKKHKERDGK